VVRGITAHRKPPDVRIWSCMRSLRIIHSAQKPVTMSPFHHPLGGHCHGTNPLFLPARARCSDICLPAALRAVAHRRCCPSPADRALQAPTTQAIQGTQTFSRTDPEAPLRPVCAGRGPSSRAASDATRADAPEPSPPPHGGHLQALLSPEGLSVSRLAGAGEPARQRPSQRWPVAAMPLYCL